MPNWCENALTIRNDDARKIQELAQAAREGRLLNALCPQPDGLDLTGEKVDGNGMPEWWNWRLENWGTKWEVDASETATEVSGDGTRLEVYFNSAWSPPVEAYRFAEKSGLQIDAVYFEGGMGFAGHYKNGHDDYHEVGGWTADEFEKRLPKVDERLGVSERMREWDDEDGDGGDENA